MTRCVLVVSMMMAMWSCGGGGGGSSDDATTDGDGTDAPPPVVAWDEEDLGWRLRVTVNPHPDRDREDLPVIALVEHPGAWIARDVAVWEVTGDDTTGPIEASAWCQPDGTVMEVGFTAEGTTPAGATRTFLVYHDVLETPEPWQWADGGLGTFAMLDEDEDGTDDGLRIEASSWALQREVSESEGTVRAWRREGEGTSLEHGGSQVAEGFSSGYQIESLTETFEPHTIEQTPFDAIATDRDEFAAAVGIEWDAPPGPPAHDAFLTYRLFADFPFMEMVLSATVEDAGEHRFSSAAYSGRHVYLTDEYDRMVSDGRGDEALARTWDTGMRWLVVYDEATDRGFGWFIHARGVIRPDDEDGVDVFDSYGYSADATTALRSLWMAGDDKDAIVDLFDAMQPGVTVGATENRDVDIAAPGEGTFLFDGDTLEVLVSTPGGGSGVTATIDMADGTTVDVPLEREDGGLAWRASDPVVLGASHPEGTWSVTAANGAAQATATFEVRHPDHPKLLFGPEDVADLQDRRTDPAHADIWEAMLTAAERADPPIESPGPGIDIRSYGTTLATLALVQLVDPSQPYEELMWDYFFHMLRYPNWDPEATEFNNHDLTVGHFLFALAFTYDLHHDGLTPAERAEVRAHLSSVATRWLQSSWMRIYRDIDWSHYGTVTNNHYWINHCGVAAAAFVLEDEMPEDDRQVIVEHTEENLGIILGVLEDDGTSHEGVAYHSYGQINLFPWIDMRDRALGGDTARSVPWFAESVSWDLYSIMPGGIDNYGGVANFGDCPTRHYNPPRTISAWLAARLDDPRAQWEAESLDREDVTFATYLWYDPSVTAAAPGDLPTSRLFPDKGIFAWRSSWENDATYFSSKSGSYFGGHEQPDAGQFILHRAGVPYVIDHGYSYWKMTDEHNVILVEGTGQHGEDRQWMGAVEPASWASVRSTLATDGWFDVVMDPTPMYASDDLLDWSREVVGIGPDVFLVRDAIATTGVEIDWLLHSYVSEPPTSAGRTYSYGDHRTEDPWTEDGPGLWTITPQASAEPLHLADASVSSWSDTLEASTFVPEQHPDGGYNSGFDAYQFGVRLRRSATGADLDSLVVLWFGDVLEVESISDGLAAAARVRDGTTDVAIVVWPLEGSVSAFHDLDVTASMAGRTVETWFGRDVTHLAHAGTTLVESDVPLDVHSRLETAAPSAILSVDAEATVTLYCPTEPSTVTLDGAPSTGFGWAAGQLTLTVPAGEHLLEIGS